MSANPLQGIQVINSVNPCSSTPLHRPIYPYHYRESPVLPRPLPSLFSTSTLARSSSLHLPHPLTWNLDSPLPGTTHPPLRLQEKVENCDYKDFPGAASPPNAPPRFLLTSSFLRSILSFLLLLSSRLLLTATFQPLPFPVLFSIPLLPLLFFVLFSISHSSQSSHDPSHPQFFAPRPCAARSFSD